MNHCWAAEWSMRQTFSNHTPKYVYNRNAVSTHQRAQPQGVIKFFRLTDRKNLMVIALNAAAADAADSYFLLRCKGSSGTLWSVTVDWPLSGLSSTVLWLYAFGGVSRARYGQASKWISFQQNYDQRNNLVEHSTFLWENKMVMMRSGIYGAKLFTFIR